MVSMCYTVNILAMFFSGSAHMLYIKGIRLMLATQVQLYIELAYMCGYGTPT